MREGLGESWGVGVGVGVGLRGRGGGGWREVLALGSLVLPLGKPRAREPHRWQPEGCRWCRCRCPCWCHCRCCCRWCR